MPCLKVAFGRSIDLRYNTPTALTSQLAFAPSILFISFMVLGYLATCLLPNLPSAQDAYKASEQKGLAGAKRARDRHGRYRCAERNFAHHLRASRVIQFLQRLRHFLCRIDTYFYFTPIYNPTDYMVRKRRIRSKWSDW